MALAPCRECGKEVSTEALACPHCGVPKPATRMTAGGRSSPRSTAGAERRTTGDYVGISLSEGERVVYRTRLHWIGFLPGGLVMVAAVALAVITAPHSLWAGLGLLAVGVLIGAWLYLAYVSSEFAVTTARVVIKTGWLSRRSIEVLVSKVESISVDQSVLGRLFDYGDIVITGSGGTREAFTGIASPLELRERVQAQIIAGDTR